MGAAVVLSLLLAIGPQANRSYSAPTVKSASGDLATYVNSFVAGIPREGSEAYDVPTSSERSTMVAAYDAIEAGDLSRAASLADPLGYDVVQYEDTVSGRTLVILSERQNPDGSWPHAWGMYIFSPRESSDTTVEVTHPVADWNTEDIGVETFRKANAEDLFIAGAHRYANSDGSADVAHADASVFEDVHEAAIESSTKVFQPHGFSQTSHPDCGEVVVSAGKSPPTELAQKVYDDLRSAGFNAILYDGDSCPELGATTNIQGVFARTIGANFLHVESSKPIRDDDARRSLLSGTIAGSLGSSSGTQVSLLPPDQSGAQAQADLAFLNRTPTKIYHVAKNGSDTNPGTQASPWKTIQKAATSLGPGEAAYVHGGTYYERITTTNPGEPEAPIWLMEAPGENVVIKGTGTSGGPFVRITQPYWIVDGFEIDAGGSFAHAVRFDGTNHAVARNIDAHNGIGNAAVVFYKAQNAALLNSRVHEYSWTDTNGSPKDSHGVLVYRDSKSILVKGNDSWGHTGDDLQCVDEDSGSSADDPTDITIEGNRYGNTYPGGTLRTRTRENAIDIKTCHNVTVRGNKMFGFRPPSTAPGGAALVAHVNADKVLVEQNRFWDNGIAASLGSQTNCCLGSVVFRRNLIFDSTTESGGTGGGVRVGPATRFEAYHNTFHNVPAYAIRLGDDARVDHAVLINNIVSEAGSAIQIYAPNVPDLTSDRNLFWNAPLPNGWQYDRTSVFQDPMFVDDPRNNDYYTKPGSPARDVALHEPLSVDSRNSTYCAEGPDIGFLETCDSASPTPTSATLVGAGDIATGGSATEETAKLVRAVSGTVFTAGDNAYDSGTDAEFQSKYDPTWGTEKTRTRPSVGNHEYVTPGASGYFNYFGAAAGARDKGYYSYDLGEWHIISLNSMCENVGGCGATSPMVTWLKNDLAANASHECTLTYFHHPLFSSGEHGNQTKMKPTWDALYAANADVVVNGHDHDYERFAPQNPSGTADSSRGIREFVVGTGGAGLRSFGTIKPNSQAHNSDTHGVLKLTLNSASYDWQFVPVAGKSFADSGSSGCH